ncbi:MAG: hypothetical protein DCF25_10160 [Leptolyngbya foveolarum]|uniref:TrwC relaxase domain-containing protein n=1 Tax=Leptolyngbya foveolarum TaxID=47253 RepID=A0A2W4UD98_9CYAN|nr:MAG: hypothetical protein DCF25_10160 [Leptolyngbya foveolarum]
MLTSANVCVAQAENYYEKDDYYTQGDPDLESDTKWQGNGAAALGLEGPVDQAVFKQLLQGQTPDGDSLHSRQIDLEKHRAATDYTFSAPKSVSIAGLIQKDKRVIAAHDRAVETALGVLESRYAQTRVRRGPGIRERVQTESMIAAKFRHETSREQDPQLHTHCVVINATQLSNGQWQSMANEEVINNKKLLGEIYQNELAVQMRHLGYEIAPQGNGLFECKAYEKPLLDLFSTRSQQIEKYVERWEESLKDKGGKPLSAKQKEQATLATRLRKKSVPREVLLDGWHQAIASSEIHLPEVPDIASVEVDSRAQVSATEGVNHAAERESVFKREKVERFALDHHLGEQSFDELQTAMAESELIPAKDRFTTETAIERELDTISMMRQGQGQVEAIATCDEVEALTAGELTLTTGQYQAILETAISRDQFVAWQGVAGAGKTYSLKLLAQIAIEQGYEVTGYAPSSQAATVLKEEAHIESNTVARLLHSDGRGDNPKQAIWIVDEAGLLSAKDAHSLLKKARVDNARVVLVGDTRQLSAVEAGNPFRSLQSAGLKTSFLEESRRQKTEALRAAVVCLAAGQQSEGLDRLDNAGMVHEQKEGEYRHRSITAEYILMIPEAREKTLILSGTNVERLALTAQLRGALQVEGSLGEDRFAMSSLRALDRTAAQLKYACSYEANDIIVPVRDYRRYGMERREQYRVIERDIEANQLMLEAPGGRQFSFDPATCADKTAYEVQSLAIAQGDQLRWTRNEAVEGARNGQVVTVESVDVLGMATVRDAKGETMALTLTGQQYLDYALVSTTYSSQGKTADTVLADVDSTLSQEGLYVAVSRAKSHLSLYTADREKLYKKAQRSTAKENPSDWLTLFQMVNPNVQQTPQPARDLRGENQSQYIGDRVGERSQGRYRTAVRRADLAAPRSQPVKRTAASPGRSVRPQYEPERSVAVQRDHQAYQQYAAMFEDVQSPYERDLLVVRRMTSELTAARNSRVLNKDELQQVARVLAQGPVVQQLKRIGGKKAELAYVTDVLVKEQKIAKQRDAERVTPVVPEAQKAQPTQPSRKQHKQQDKGIDY